MSMTKRFVIEPLLLPKGIRLWQDTGFIGHKPDGVEICMPKKKPKGKSLLLLKNKRTSGFPESGLKWSMP
jgi:hypothetical protein